jgi:hypothetical protein
MRKARLLCPGPYSSINMRFQVLTCVFYNVHLHATHAYLHAYKRAYTVTYRYHDVQYLFFE